MTKQVPKRQLFGRKPDLEYLSKRAQGKGLTVVAGRPQSGKTWLLREFVNRLSTDDSYFVGYAQSTGQYADLLLRSLQDLYTRWLSDASAVQQAKSLWKRHNDTIVARLGTSVGSGLGILLEGTTQAKGLGGAIERFFNGLRKADTDLRSGGIQLPTLDYDTARNLLLVLDNLAEGNKRTVLILDAFDQSEGAKVQAKILRTFLTRLEEWPECHMLLATRKPDTNDEETAALKCAKDLVRASVAAEFWSLPELHLQEDVGERDRLLFYLHDKVPATKDLADELVLELIGGYAGVIGRWVQAGARQDTAPQNRADLERLAQNAHALRYREIEELLSKLKTANEPLFLFSLRLALLPEMASQAEFDALRAFVLQDQTTSSLVGLQADGLLHIVDDNPEVPSFGHTKRYEAVRRLICTEEHYKPFARAQAELLAVELASGVNNLHPNVVPLVAALRSLRSIGADLGVSRSTSGLCEAAASLLGERLSSAQSQLVAEASALVRTHPVVGTLVAMGLLNSLNGAKEENDLTRRDALLEELNNLAAAQADHGGVQELLARGLFNTLNDAKEENDLTRRDALLDELRQLAAAQADHGGVQELLARGLFNALNDAKEENDLTHRDALLDELRQLAGAQSDQGGVQEMFAIGLSNTLNDAKEENDLTRRDALLDELRQVAAAHPDHGSLQEQLTKGLLNTLNSAKDENDLTRRDAFLDELRELAAAQPDHDGVQESLAMGLVNTLNYAKQENDLTRRDALLDELRQLSAAHPDHDGVQENYLIRQDTYLAGPLRERRSDWSPRDDERFDVFLIYNNSDRAIVRQIADRLAGRGIKAWFEDSSLRPGVPWQNELERIIEEIEAAALFVGPSGLGPWQQTELSMFLRDMVARKRPVIPVMLPGCHAVPRLPLFLHAYTWIDFRVNKPDPLDVLVWGITGKRMESM